MWRSWVLLLMLVAALGTLVVLLRAASDPPRIDSEAERELASNAGLASGTVGSRTALQQVERSVRAAPVPMRLSPGRGRFVVSVADCAGAPVEGACVVATRDSAPVASGIVAASGEIALLGARPADEFEIQPPTGRPDLGTTHLRYSELRSRTEVRLPRASVVRGTLRDQTTGVPLAYASITWVAATADGAPSEGRTTTGEVGEFVVGGLRSNCVLTFHVESPAGIPIPRDVEVQGDSGVEDVRADLTVEAGRLCRVRINPWDPRLRPRAVMTPTVENRILPALEAAVSGSGVALFWGVPEADAFTLTVASTREDQGGAILQLVDLPPLGEVEVVPMRGRGPASGHVLLPPGSKLELLALRTAGGVTRIPCDESGFFELKSTPNSTFYFECVLRDETGRSVRQVITGREGPGNDLEFR